MTTIACALWKNKLYPWDSINTGEMRGKNFTVIIAGMPSPLYPCPGDTSRHTWPTIFRLQLVPEEQHGPPIESLPLRGLLLLGVRKL